MLPRIIGIDNNLVTMPCRSVELNYLKMVLPSTMAHQDRTEYNLEY
jgi:hypothetical protein